MNEKNGLEQLASHRIRGVLPKKYHMEYRSGREELVEEQSLKEVEEMILAAGEHLDMPESLRPENVSRRLEQVQKRRIYRRKMILTVLVCMIALIIAVIIFAQL